MSEDAEKILYIYIYLKKKILNVCSSCIYLYSPVILYLQECRSKTTLHNKI
jgi:hypothetical protein